MTTTPQNRLKPATFWTLDIVAKDIRPLKFPDIFDNQKPWIGCDMR